MDAFSVRTKNYDRRWHGRAGPAAAPGLSGDGQVHGRERQNELCHRPTAWRNGGEFKIFSDVQADPDIATVTRGVEQILEFQPDAVVAFGGGSAIDAAKAIVFFAARERDMRDCKFIAIPPPAAPARR